MLTRAGLSAAEEAVYLALVRQGSASIADLAGRVGRTVSQVRRVVGALEREGFVHRTPPPEERVVAVPPELAVEQYIRRRHEDLDSARAAAHLLAQEAQQRTSNRRSEELIEIVSGRRAVGRAFERVQRTARTTMRVLVAPPYADRSAVNQTQLDREADGVSYRVVYDTAALSDPIIDLNVATHLRTGEQARLAQSVPTKLAVADRALALLPLSWNSAAHDSALMVHPCGLLDAVVALFEIVWAQATPLSISDPRGPTSGPPIGAEDRHLLSLLVAGLTDDTVAARLGISRRTVVRRVQHLMTLANARSRLQLGWHAHDRGWL